MELNYKHFGQGEPMIVLHGLFGMLDNWLTIGKKLAEKYEVFLIDQRNHGKSPHTKEHNYLLMAGDLFDFLQERNIHSAHLLGHSMGGKTAMQFAMLHPDYVKSLIIADIFPKKYNHLTDDHKMVFNAIQLLKNCRFSNRKEAEQKLAEIITDKRLLQFMYKNLAINQSSSVRWKFNADVLLNEYMKLMDNIHFSVPINVPVLFIKAENSDYIDEKELEKVKEIFPNATLRIMPNCGHWLHADNPELFLKIVFDFLSNATS